jgi:hypothetical protein
MMWTRLVWLRIGTGGDFCEFCIEPSAGKLSSGLTSSGLSGSAQLHVGS